LQESLARLKERYIAWVLAHSDGDKGRAARILADRSFDALSPAARESRAPAGIARPRLPTNARSAPWRAPRS